MLPVPCHAPRETHTVLESFLVYHVFSSNAINPSVLLTRRKCSVPGAQCVIGGMNEQHSALFAPLMHPRIVLIFPVLPLLLAMHHRHLFSSPPHTTKILQDKNGD